MKKINKATIYIALGTLVTGFLIGWLSFSDTTKESTTDQHMEQAKKSIWTCSMHPHIRQFEPGQCPICGMDLIPLNSEFSSDENPLEIKMSSTAMKLANVQTSIVAKQKPIKEVRMNGTVKADERKVFSQVAHISGRIESLQVNFTGERVSKGQVLAYIYSPDLVTAQEELFQAYKIRASQPELYQASRGKLLKWKLTEKQVDNIIQAGQPVEEIPVLADVTGIALNKHVNLGDYVQKGQSLFDIADLSSVWVLFDVYESDINWIKIGDEVSFSIQSQPGESYNGNLTFVDPVINPKTRIATARIELANPGMKLKPEMFAVGVVSSSFENEKEVLTVPKSAVMWTGERSVVYVKRTSVSGVGFIMREVKLGSVLGNSYFIKEGLKEGEEIATNGTFSIDAAAQLAGKPSMMNPEGGVAMTGHNHGETSNKINTIAPDHSPAIDIGKKAKEALKPIFDEYLKLKDALVANDFEKSQQIASSILSELDKIKMTVFSGEAQNIWMQHSIELKKSLKAIRLAENISGVRRQTRIISNHYITIAKTFQPYKNTLYIQYCPMANDNGGAYWLSTSKAIKNPYFGKSMLNCGETKDSVKIN